MTDIDLNTLTLTDLPNPARENGVTLMEAAAWLAGEPHTSRPQSVSPVLAAIGDSLSSRLPAAKRQRLIPALVDLIATRGPRNLDVIRAYMFLDWRARTEAPAWCDAAGHPEVAGELRALPPITGREEAAAATPTIRDSYNRVHGANRRGNQTVWEPIGPAGSTRVWDAVRDMAGASVSVDVKHLVRAASDAADETAAKAVIGQLQDSAIDLFVRMIHPQATG